MISFRPSFSLSVKPALHGALLIATLLCSRTASSEIIPADRRTDWTPGTIVGVPGGIPNRASIFYNIVTDGGADNTGGVDAKDIILNALNNCPAGKVVYMPAGTYKIGGRIRPNGGIQKNWTLRGAGMGLTILKPATGFSGGSMFDIGASGDVFGPYAVTAGATKNSQTITMASTTNIPVGNLIKIAGGSATVPWVHSIGNAGGTNPSATNNAGTLAWMFRVISKTSTTVTFAPKLPMDMSALDPQISTFNFSPAEGVGFENFTIDSTGGPNYVVPMTWGQTWGCWMKGIELKNYPGKGCLIGRTTSSEFRGCYFHGGSNGSGGEGFDFAGANCWNLIEDNIVYNGGSIFLNDAGEFCSGNVIGYNFAYGHVSPDPNQPAADMDLGHGSGNTFNLVEGNVIGIFAGNDGYYGGHTHSTVFRNWITATHPVATVGRRAIILKHFAPYWNIVGNVLGTSAFPKTNDGPLVNLQAGHGGFYEVTTAAYSGGNQTGTLGPAQVIYELGYPNIGNTNFNGTVGPTTPPDYTEQPTNNSQNPAIGAQNRDLNVTSTIIRHGNYDFFNLAQKWETDNTNVADHTDRNIPDSLYTTRAGLIARGVKLGSLNFPPINPAAPPSSFSTTDQAHPPVAAAQIIPAVYRYYHDMTDPGGSLSAPSGLRIVE